MGSNLLAAFEKRAIWGKRGARRLLVCATAAVAALLASAASQGQQQPLTCLGAAATMVGTAGSDSLMGTPGDDVILGLDGDDQIASDAGNDRICGGPGNDTIIADVGDDQVDAGEGGDGIEGGPGNDVIDGGEGSIDLATFILSTGVRVDLAQGTASGHGSDTLRGVEAVAGSAFRDVLIGDAGMNFFIPLAGDDEVRGGGGYDLVVFFLAAVTADLASGRATGEGTDLIEVEGASGGGAGPVTLLGDGRDNYLQGSGGNDVLRGRGGDDRLNGLAGNDTLSGDAGADSLSGGPGNDVLDGGSGPRDEVTYLQAVGPVQIDLAARRAVGEGTDTLRRIERVTGSQLDDEIRGDSGGNSLYGNGGNDRLEGRAGSDFLDGGSDRDVASGGSGPRPSRGRPAAFDYCVDLESSSGCEQSERSGDPGGVRSATARSARLQATSALAPSTCRSVRCLLRALQGPWAGGRALAGLADTVHYKYDPECVPRGRTYTTTVAPPTDVGLVQPPNRVQTVVWQGKLYRYSGGGRGTVVYQTPVARAPIAGPNFPHVGTPFWTHDRTGRAFQKRLSRRITQPGQYRWEGAITWIEAQRPVVTFLRPHVVKPGERPSPFCVVGR